MTRKYTILMAVIAAAGMTAGCEPIRAQNYSFTPTYSETYRPYTPVYVPVNQAATYGAAADVDSKFSNTQLDQMLGPIALYPDPLLMEVLAAATYPQDVSELNAVLKVNESLSDEAVERETWDVSVKALAKYPQVVRMMASQPDWMANLGNAMVNQQQDVMDSVQRLRAQARAAQNLNSTPQQEVIADDGVIQILPAQQQVIYVPTYDPLLAYSPQPFGTQCLWFGAGIGINRYWDLNCDWRRREICRVNWGHGGWRGPVTAGNWQHDRSRPVPPAKGILPTRVGGGVPSAPRGAVPAIPRTGLAPKGGVTPKVVEGREPARPGFAPAKPGVTQGAVGVPTAPKGSVPQVGATPAKPTFVPAKPAAPLGSVPQVGATPSPAKPAFVPAVPATPKVAAPPAAAPKMTIPTPPRQIPPAVTAPPRAIAPVTPRVQPMAPARPIERAISMPAPRPMPAAPVIRSAPAAPQVRSAPAPQIRSAPSPASHSSGGGGRGGRR